MQTTDHSVHLSPVPAGPLLVITRWTPTEAERRAILEGDDIYVTLTSRNGSISPFFVTVGRPVV